MKEPVTQLIEEALEAIDWFVVKGYLFVFLVVYGLGALFYATLLLRFDNGIDILYVFITAVFSFLFMFTSAVFFGEVVDRYRHLYPTLKNIGAIGQCICFVISFYYLVEFFIALAFVVFGGFHVPYSTRVH